MLPPPGDVRGELARLVVRMEASDVLVVSVVARPGALAPRRRAPLEGGTPAARSRRVEVGGVRRVKWKVRSGRTVIRAGMGVPGVMEAVRALNSCGSVSGCWSGEFDAGSDWGVMGV